MFGRGLERPFVWSNIKTQDFLREEEEELYGSHEEAESKMFFHLDLISMT